MQKVENFCDILNLIDYAILGNNSGDICILHMNKIHKFILKSEQIHFDPQICLLETANYMITKLYETSCSELHDKYYQMRTLLLESLRRSQEDDEDMPPM